MSRVIAFFDFDGTLTRRDSLVPFLRMVRGATRLALDLLAVSPQLAAYTVRMMRNDRAKEALLQQALGGQSIEELRAYGQRFAELHVPRMLREDIVARLRAHQSQGHYCVLVSASLDIYLEPWANIMGFEHCIASSLAVDSCGKVTGRLVGGNCHGEEKARRIRKFLERNGPISRTYAYGDSPGDAYMLGIVDEGYWVANEITPFHNVMPARCGTK